MEPSGNQGALSLPGRENRNNFKEEKKTPAGCAAGEGPITVIFPIPLSLFVIFCFIFHCSFPERFTYIIFYNLI